MQDQTPITWQDGVTSLNDANFNTEIRNAALLLLNPPTCQLRKTAGMVLAQSTGFPTWTVFTWDTVVFDTEDPATPMANLASFPTRITVTTPGWYECIASVEVGTVPGLLTLISCLRINGTAYYLGSSVYGSAGPLDICVSNLLPFNAGDYVELLMASSWSTGTTTTAVAGFTPVMTISRRRGI